MARSEGLPGVDSGGGRHPAYAYITTEAPGGGLQIIDLTNLPTSVSLANTLTEFSTSHTLYISNVDYSSMTALPGQQAYLYIAGANVAGGAFRIYDLADPENPALVTPSPAGSGYMHDSTSMLITDNRTTQCANAHNPCEVLVDFNELSVDLWDVTEKAAPVRLSTTTYPTATYVHSGWPTQDNRFIIVHDELDELRRSLNTHIYTLDIADLRAPSLVTSYIGGTTSTDHNGYTIGNRYYVAHYKRGLVIFDSTTPTALTEIGSFDTYLTPSANSAGTDGVWGVYPFLPSGTLLVSDIENGLFLLKRNETLPPPAAVPNPPTAPPPRGGGGGGGSLDPLLLILLAGFAMLRGLQAQRKTMDYLPADSRYKSMRYNRVGASGVRLPAISLGLWHNFGDVDVFQNGRTIARRAFDLGITHFDLANNYGPSPGSAEENFGLLMKKDFHPFRDEMIISSKAGYLMWPGPYGEWGSRKYLVASCDQSLTRMGLRTSTSSTAIASIRTRRSRRPWARWITSCARAARCMPASPATTPSRPRAPRRSCASSARPA